MSNIDSTGSSFPKLVIIFTLLLLFTGSVVNLDGGDWDGNQITIGSIFFHQASQGDNILYNFFWQPLTYGIIRLIYLLTGNVPLLFYLPAVFGSLGMTIYLAAMQKAASFRLGIIFLLGLLLLMPEFIFSSIYMNSTVFGFPFAAAAFWFVLDLKTLSCKSPRGFYDAFLAGFCITIAALCRFEFLLVFPILIFLLLKFANGNFIKEITAFSLGSAVIFSVAWAAGFFAPLETVKTAFLYEAVVGKRGVFDRSVPDSLLISYIGINTFAWILAAVAAVCFVLRTIRNKKWLNISIIISGLLLAYPVGSLTSAKYLLPLYMVLGLLIAKFLSDVTLTRKSLLSLFSIILAFCVILACFLPVCPTTKNGVSLKISTATWKETDDGPRSFWGYCYAIRHYSVRTECPEQLKQYLHNPENLLLIGPNDGWISSGQVQPYILFIINNCTDIKADSKYVLGEIKAKKIVLTDPENVAENREKHFLSAGITPVQKTAELQLKDMEIHVLESIYKGTNTIKGLVEKLNSDNETVSDVIKTLRERGLINLMDDDTYEAERKIYMFEPEDNN